MFAGTYHLLTGIYIVLGVIKRPCMCCRKAKVKCDRQVPCGRCTRRDLECIYLCDKSDNVVISDKITPAPIDGKIHQEVIVW